MPPETELLKPPIPEIQQKEEEANSPIPEASVPLSINPNPEQRKVEPAQGLKNVHNAYKEADVNMKVKKSQITRSFLQILPRIFNLTKKRKRKESAPRHFGLVPEHR
jgi:GTPase SAR1 family protein